VADDDSRTKGEVTKKEMTPMDRLADLTKRVVAVPKDEVDKRAKTWAEKRRRKRRR
jgi:hypothetical protein